MDRPERKDTAQRALLYAAIAVAVVVILVLIWYAIDVVVLAFIGILLAILLRAPADWLAAHTGLRESWSLALVGVTLVGVVAALGVLFGRGVAAEALQLVDRIPGILEDRQDAPAGERTGPPRRGARRGERRFLPRRRPVSRQGLGLLGSIGVVANIVIVLFFAVFMAAEPRQYASGRSPAR